ncbi:unnamed protein product [Acanthoscelides obtectus]|uniref:Uncharacterized protein n=1 Tax=Acanthoscelides obtectus TaxID=200917 RepID=A0A9P0JNU9_ACAOB|nr:unnamed protein product [Acanthoscelides obtectus]CAK1667910.1 hypothetical protein AOBTE_LOCUS26109 [Acanthoscelides obtectus]
MLSERTPTSTTSWKKSGRICRSRYKYQSTFYFFLEDILASISKNRRTSLFPQQKEAHRQTSTSQVRQPREREKNLIPLLGAAVP